MVVANPSATSIVDNRKRKLDAVASSVLVPKPKIPTTQSLPPCRPALDADHPLLFLKLILSVAPEGKKLLEEQKTNFSFRKPSQQEIDSYDMEVVRAVRSGSVDKLRSIMANGRKDFNACNRFGESLIHMACRRGNVDVVRFLLKEGSTRTDMRDDYGRTPAHDACWTADANIEVMDELLQRMPIAILLTEDVRGFTPFQYARKEHWPAWVDFLKDRRLILLKRLALDVDQQSKDPVNGATEEKLVITG